MNKQIKARTFAIPLPQQTGVTLVELLIAMLIGLFLVGGIMQVFSSSRQTYRVQDASSRMQESGRMALEVLSRDLRIAGFWGCVSNRAKLVDNLDPAGTGYVDYLNGGITGIEGDPGDPDSLTVRSGVDLGLMVKDPGSSAFEEIHIDDIYHDDIKSEKMLEQGDIVMVSDCTSGDLFQITDKPDDKKLDHEIGSGSPGNVNISDPGCTGTPNAHCFSKTYGEDAKVLMTQEITYTIADGSEGQPALFRNGVEFVDGIDNLQVLYGEDTDASRTANYFVPADEVVDMASVVTVRIAVVARSYEDNLTGGIKQNYDVLGTNLVAADDRLRQVYTSTIALRNRL